jgi:hypothetical protein
MNHEKSSLLEEALWLIYQSPSFYDEVRSLLDFKSSLLSFNS